MVDKLTPERRSANMARIGSKNTKPELLVRQAAHAAGFRFRLHRKDLPGKPDLVFPRHRAVIFVHGCFWHMHPDSACKDARAPKSRLEYWGPKLARNQERDASTQKALQEAGWRTLTVWDCETKDMKTLESRLRDFLNGQGLQYDAAAYPPEAPNEPS
jgi:DNA mismatch endonuclease (patch repair protein)